MANSGLSDEDVERVSNRVANKLLRYAVIGLVVWFVVIPLILFFVLGAFSFNVPNPGGRF